MRLTKPQLDAIRQQLVKENAGKTVDEIARQIFYDLIRTQRDLISRYAKENPPNNDGLWVFHALVMPWAERGNLTPLEFLLIMGSLPQAQGVSLTPAECDLLLQVLRGDRKVPAGRHFNKKTELRNAEIRNYIELLEAEMSTEAAVARTMEVFRLSRAAVFNVRLRTQPILPGPSIAAGKTAEQRRALIKFIEEACEQRRPEKKSRARS